MQLCHINLLKPYFTHAPGPVSVSSAVTLVNSAPPLDPIADTEEELDAPDNGIFRGRHKKSCQLR